ncbi:V-type proton ATPase subunit E [Dictyocoela muelleri]|nr:V-type proton ATPase subunit E [Dictyocoela muelleri]
MDTTSDLKKMIDFINYEAQQKINELQIIAKEEYNTNKSKHLSSLKKDLATFLQQRKNEIKIDFMTKLSAIKNKFKMEFLEEKDKLLSSFFKKVTQKLHEKNLNNKLLSCHDELRSEEGKEENLFNSNDLSSSPIFHVLDKDKPLIYKLFPNSVVRTLDDKFLGGVILLNKDSSILIDNTFLTRLNIFKERYLGLIYKDLFDE